MPSLSYSEKLRDPRWQRLRLEVMQRDSFTCQRCFDTESTLNVHHNYYTAGNAPWEYPLEALLTLCEECHGEETANRKEEEAFLLRVCRKIGFSYSNLNALYIGLNEAFGEGSSVPDYLEYELSWIFSHFAEVRELILPLREREAIERANRVRAANGIPLIPEASDVSND